MPAGLFPIAVLSAVTAVCWAVQARNRRHMFAEVRRILERG